eukprot:jgi/Botrbrau1/13156/Bobra.0187s0104.1
MGSSLGVLRPSLIRHAARCTHCHSPCIGSKGRIKFCMLLNGFSQTIIILQALVTAKLWVSRSGPPRREVHREIRHNISMVTTITTESGQGMYNCL